MSVTTINLSDNQRRILTQISTEKKLTEAREQEVLGLIMEFNKIAPSEVVSVEFNGKDLVVSTTSRD